MAAELEGQPLRRSGGEGSVSGIRAC